MKQLCYSLAIFLGCLNGSLKAADNLLLVSIDGLRWQEVFRGYQDDVLNLEEFNAHKSALQTQFSGKNIQQKRQKLMPFLWQVVAKQGVLIGNRDNHSKMQLTNDLWFSYPGYNELLTGKADPTIDSNQASDNTNITFLEWLNAYEGYQQQVAAFGSWDVFPAIMNRKRSKININAGFESADWPDLSDKAKWLNVLQKQIPSPWHNVRLDAFTSGFAEEYILAHQPKVIYLALGETDDFAHQGNYPEYLRGAKRADQFIAQLWTLLQSMEQYQGKTNLVITVDHGRGDSAATWQHHASPKAVKGYLDGLSHYKQGIPGANHVWLAAMGPDVKNLGENHGVNDEVSHAGSVKRTDEISHEISHEELNLIEQKKIFRLDQVAATVLQLLDVDHQQFAKDIGEPLPIIKHR